MQREATWLKKKGRGEGESLLGTLWQQSESLGLALRIVYDWQHKTSPGFLVNDMAAQRSHVFLNSDKLSC